MHVSHSTSRQARASQGIDRDSSLTDIILTTIQLLDVGLFALFTSKTAELIRIVFLLWKSLFF